MLHQSQKGPGPTHSRQIALSERALRYLRTEKSEHLARSLRLREFSVVPFPRRMIAKLAGNMRKVRNYLSSYGACRELRISGETSGKFSAGEFGESRPEFWGKSADFRLKRVPGVRILRFARDSPSFTISLASLVILGHQ